MKEKNLPLDYQHNSLEELTEKANRIIESLENENNLSNSVDSYQELLKLNNLIEKKFQKNLKFISEKIIINPMDYYFSNVIARASKTMAECRNEKTKIERTGTEG